MISQERTLEQIRLIGLKALSRDLGPVDMIRFLQQFETGQGDYSAERYTLLDQITLDEALTKIRQRRQES